jgi:hypothetical protein
MMGKIDEVFRLPMCETSAANKVKLRELIVRLGLIAE